MENESKELKNRVTALEWRLNEIEPKVDRNQRILLGDSDLQIMSIVQQLKLMENKIDKIQRLQWAYMILSFVFGLLIGYAL